MLEGNKENMCDKFHIYSPLFSIATNPPKLTNGIAL